MKKYILPVLLFAGLYNAMPSDIKVKKGLGSEYNLSYEEGLKQINKLARTSKIEDDWIFIDKWYDAGTDEKESSVTEDDDYIAKLVKEKNPKELHSIHIHPREEGEQSSPPSFTDLASYVNDLNCNVINLIADGNGVWKISLSEETEYILSLDEKDLDFISFEILYNEMSEELYKFSNKKRSEYVNKCIELYKKIGVDLEYTEME